MTGSQTLYTGLFPSAIPENPGEKGKRNAFIERRHDAMASRFYFHAQLRRLRYDDCICELSDEFHLSHNVVTLNLRKRIDFIKKLVEEKATVTDLQRDFPYFNWNYKLAVKAA